MKNINVRIDNDGDTYVEGYDRYVRHGHVFKMHMEQVMKNYEDVYGKTPNKEDLDKAFQFAYTILAEIAECYPKSYTARHISAFSSMFAGDACNAIEDMSALSEPTVVNNLTIPNH